MTGQTSKPENRILRPDRHRGMTGETERNTNTANKTDYTWKHTEAVKTAMN